MGSGASLHQGQFGEGGTRDLLTGLSAPSEMNCAILPFG